MVRDLTKPAPARIYTQCIRRHASAHIRTALGITYIMDMNEHDARNALERKVLITEDIDEQLVLINTANIISITLAD